MQRERAADSLSQYLAVAFEPCSWVSADARETSWTRTQKVDALHREWAPRRDDYCRSCSCCLPLDMKVVSRILSSGMQGHDVRDLHHQLEELGFFVPPVERTRGLFGPGTKRAVMDVQRKHFSHSRVTGILDQATANLIDMETGREG